MKAIVGLGNPGPEYDATRHNVGWWVVDRLSADWGLGPLRREGNALLAAGTLGDEQVVLIKPLTYMNRSGAALAPLARVEGFDFARDLLIVVDDVALDTGRMRLRSSGGSGGHNGLKSVQAAIGSQEYSRLRVGVGAPGPGEDLVARVLSAPTPEEEDEILALFPEIVDGVREWIDGDEEAAMRRLNR